MIDPLTFKASVAYNKQVEEENASESSPNPLRLKANLSSLAAISNYNQVLLKPKIDKDTIGVINAAAEMMKLVPAKLELPYSFKTDDINGERIYDNNGKLKLIKEYKSDTITEYYPSENPETIKNILEKDKAGNIISKIQPVKQEDGTYKTNVIIFDEKINNKYIMFQVEDSGNINSVTEIFENGKNFRSLIFNPKNLYPERYIESKENKDGEFELTDCKFGKNFDVKELKQITPAKEVNITYSGNRKDIDVRRKIPEE